MTEPGQHWKILFEPQPEKIMRRLPRNLLRRVDQAILALAEDPRPPGCKRLVGFKNLYRIRVGGWRVTYAIEGARLVILVLEVAPRGSAYHDL